VRCPYLRDLLARTTDKTITLDDLNRHTFSAALEYMYTDAIKSVHSLHAQEIESVLELAKKWQMTRLALLCECYLFERITTDNVIDYLQKPYSTLFPGCADFVAHQYKILKAKNVCRVRMMMM
jgi:hypothetical protein